jgi:hypothetical protein
MNSAAGLLLPTHIFRIYWMMTFLKKERSHWSLALS